MAQQTIFVNQSGANSGTNEAANPENTQTTATSCLISGGIPSTNGTLTLTQPATSVVINAGAGQVAFLAQSSASKTFVANRDTYVDLDTSGTYTLAAVTNGNTAPGLTLNSIRLYKAVSGGASVTSITQLASPFGLAQSDLQVDLVENAAATALLATTPGLANLDRLRLAVTTLSGLSWANTMANTKKAILQDGTNSVTTGQLAGNWQVVQGLGIAATPVAPGSGPRVLVNLVEAGASWPTLAMGLGSFAGGGLPAFQGFPGGTRIGINEGSPSFAGSFVDFQRQGVSSFRVSGGGNVVALGDGVFTNSLSTGPTNVPGAGLGVIQPNSYFSSQQNFGLVTLGAGPWDGLSAGHFQGVSGGTVLAADVSSGFSGNLVDLQVNGSSKFSVAGNGTGVTSGIWTMAGVVFTSHVATSGVAPLVATGTGLGAGGFINASVTGNDTVGLLALEYGLSPPAGGGKLCTVTYHTPYTGSAPLVHLTASDANPALAGSGFFVLNRSTTGFEVWSFGTAAASNGQQINIAYLVVG